MKLKVQVDCKWFSLGPGHWRLIPFESIAEIRTDEKGLFQASVNGFNIGEKFESMEQAHHAAIEALGIKRPKRAEQDIHLAEAV